MPYLFGIYAELAVPLHDQVIEPSAFEVGVSVRLELLTAESIFVIVALITPVFTFTAIVFTLVSAPSDTPKLLWTSTLLGQFGHVGGLVSWW